MSFFIFWSLGSLPRFSLQSTFQELDWLRRKGLSLISWKKQELIMSRPKHHHGGLRPAESHMHASEAMKHIESIDDSLRSAFLEIGSDASSRLTTNYVVSLPSIMLVHTLQLWLLHVRGHHSRCYSTLYVTYLVCLPLVRILFL